MQRQSDTAEMVAGLAHVAAIAGTKYHHTRFVAVPVEKLDETSSVDHAIVPAQAERLPAQLTMAEDVQDGYRTIEATDEFFAGDLANDIAINFERKRR